MRAYGLFPLAGVEEPVDGVPQLFNIAMQDVAFAWFGRHLKF